MEIGKIFLHELRGLGGIDFHVQDEKCLPFSLLENGLPKAGVIEFSGEFGAGKTEAVLQFLMENPALEVAWIEKDFTIFPLAFLKYQLELSQILFIDVSSPLFKQTPYWCASQILKSQIFPVLVLSHLQISEIELRRLQLLSKKSGTLVILLSLSVLKQRNWSLTLQIHVQRCEGSQLPQLSILKSRNFSLWPPKAE